MRHLTRISRLGGLALAAALLVPASGAAQGGPGFLFKRPRVSLRVETGYSARLANSNVFDLMRDSLTLSTSDFHAPYFGGEAAVRVSERFDVAFGLGFSESQKRSEFRNWVDLDDNPIEQVTEFRLVPATLTLKYYLADRGRSVGRFAWVPNRMTPFVGAGVGIVSYRFEQSGDWVDYVTEDIFYERMISAGEAGLFRLSGGALFSLGSQFELSTEARYTHATDEMSRDFQGFEPLSLSGFQAVVGVGVRF